MANYKLIESGSGLVQNIVLWDGVSEYNVPEGYILQLITESIEWNGVSSSLSEFESTPYSGDFLGNFYGKLYGSSSYALTASYALNGGGSGGNGITSTGSFTGSFTGSVSGSLYGTASYALTASYLLNGGANIKADIVSGTTFGGTPKSASIVFPSAYEDNFYAISISAESARAWTIESKTLSGFTINSNASDTISGNVYWMTMPISSSFIATRDIVTSASYAATASFVPSIKSGTSPSSSATQSIAGEYIYNISFGTNYSINNYAVNITATNDLRIWTIESKSISGFRINSNSTVATTGDVYWVAIPYNS